MHNPKRLAESSRCAMRRGIGLLLCLVMLFSSVPFGGIASPVNAAEDTVTVTVNYVYESNDAMVAQPYTAQIEKGSAFRKTLEIPKLFNYSIPTDQAVGLGEGIALQKDNATGDYTLHFDLDAVQENVTVTLYYVAGTAKYTVYHYYQNLEDNQYALDPTIVELTGDIDAYTRAVANHKPGYRCKGIPQTTIAADGSTKVEIYYDREYYTVTFDVNGGIDGPEPIYAKYGTTFDASKVKEPKRKGYRFLGWSPELAGTVTIEQSMTYVAQWEAEKGHADYTIVLWGQNANDDEYSYLSSHQAWGHVGHEVTWDPEIEISHVHTDKCWERTCGKEEHTHTAECLKNCPHTHDAACYGGTNKETPYDEKTKSDKENIEQFKKLFGTLQNGYVYRVRCEAGASVGDQEKYDKYYLYFNDSWYLANANACDGDAVKDSGRINAHDHSRYIFTDNNKDQFWAYKAKLSCPHKHDASCCIYGMEEHKHDDTCGTLTCGLSETPKEYMSGIQPDSKLWDYKTSDTVTVAADGTTVLNVYFTRKSFTLTFKYGRNSTTTETITDRWGANVKARFDAIETNAKKSYNKKLYGWEDSTTGYYTNNVMIMPSTDKTLTAKYVGSNTLNTMTYYAADLNGVYQKIFVIQFYGDNVTVTADEYYEWEGYTINKEKSTAIGDSCKNAAFYYDRNTYNLEFYSASKNVADKEESVKYEAPLAQYDYVPTQKPDTLETDAFFAGWYQNPECTGEPYDVAVHIMPSHNIALYAKWVNGLYTVRTYTDETMQTPYTYEGYTGVQEKIEKYTLATAPTPPSKPGYVFIGWFYKDGEAEKPFSFTMPITKNYDLYPKFSEPKTVTYTVHYYKADTTDKVADDRTNSVMIGTTVTEKAKMGKDLNLVSPDLRNKYYPTNTSTSVIINEIDQEIIFYYTEATSVRYTVYYQDAIGNNLIDPETKTTAFSTVTEKYVPIPGYAPDKYSITLDLSSDPEQNKITFIYEPIRTTLTIQKSGWETIDENQTFLFHIQGIEDTTKEINLTVTVHGNGKTTITDLPVGKYRVTEMTGWSWRYAPAGNAQEITLAVGGTTLTFANQRTENNWLDGDSFRVNLFGANP